jgi:hypothetical protein
LAIFHLILTIYHQIVTSSPPELDDVVAVLAANHIERRSPRCSPITNQTLGGATTKNKSESKTGGWVEQSADRI